MPQFSGTSKDRLETCDNEIQILFNEVIKYRDCTIVEGHRGKTRQNNFFRLGKSRKQWPNGKHNSVPSIGIDAAPFLNGAISWNKYHCLYFGGFVLGIAEGLKAEGKMTRDVRYGGDWDMDDEPMTDQQLQDLVHFELV